MIFIQKEIQIPSKIRGFHIITDIIQEELPELKYVKYGNLSIFIKHTSASLTINENADPSVRMDFESHFNKMIPENMPYYKHIYEGSDDMPAHIKASIIGSSIQVPVSKGEFNLGVWQGIYLCEHRNNASSRFLVLTLMGTDK